MNGWRDQRVWVAVMTACVAGGAQAQRPEPLGKAWTTLTYMTDSGPRVLRGEFDFRGVGPRDAGQLSEDDDNIYYMNSVNHFGRRLLVEGGLRDNESLISHSLFKEMRETRGLNDFFADIREDSLIEIEVADIQFDRNVEVQFDTLMMHKLWDVDQIDLLPDPYIQFYNHDTASEDFRDFQAFFPNVFSDHPPNYRLGTLPGEGGRIEIEGNGTSRITFRLSFPYTMLRHFEESGQEVPPGLPAPFGFLEPWHLHIEYAVSGTSCQYEVTRSRARRGCGACPEPGTLVTNGDGCEETGNCRRRYKEKLDCPDGGEGTCKVKGRRRSCE